MALPSTSGTGRCCASAGVVAGPSFSGLVVRGCEVGGVTILLVGSLAALMLGPLIRTGGSVDVKPTKQRGHNVGRAILLGLEFPSSPTSS